ncbi:MAG: acyl-CoA dehydrogenase family protein [Leptospiraceae bacterium]|nr:acyl-CoA dehydrogenase family protein [Leptospiraceae bacterium]MCP5495180.1 acyl-CoA dehydrogenase family protein [Leptospiraceae bacterium]
MDFSISKEEEEFLENFHRFCQSRILPHVEEVEKKGFVPLTHFKALSEVGYTGMLHDFEYGGSGGTYLQSTMTQEILAEYCGSIFFSVGASVGLFGHPIKDFGTAEQKEKYLPPIIKGEKIGALGVTEPIAGSDVSSLQSHVRPSNGKLLLNGQKTYITNAPVCDYALILADYTEGNGHKKGLTCFIVDVKSDGVSVGKPMEKLGLKGSPTGEIFFEDVYIREEDILGRPGKGFQIIMQAFNRERLGLGAYSVGVMAACLKDCKSYSKQRKSFGKIIAKHQSVSFMLADILTKYEASKILLYETAWMMDEYQERIKNGEKVVHNNFLVDLTAKASLLKLLASTYAREVTNLAVQIHGGAGYMEEFRVARMYRDIKLAEIGGGTSEIQKQIIARSEAKRVK